MADEVGRALLQLQELIKTTQCDGEEASASGTVRILKSGESAVDVCGQLIDAARSDVGIIVQAPGSEVAAIALELLSRPGHHAHMRLLCAAPVVHSGAFRAALTQSALSYTVRVADSYLSETVVVDSRAAVLWSDRPGGGRQASFISDPASAGALSSLFATRWMSAAPAKPGAEAGRARSETGRRILESLRDGRTDEAAARELSIPLRTYRRYVAEIMREIDASSRFQAGARAVQLGLLPQGE
ncbi:DNA-binding response regulator [Streptomyces albipurpureus]|uniref:DNA-binding response regulator n=1 Tax=Streptomyces albipurpureus TaxID=2897419 RepID=A0ABT0UIK3_9ACTN|nr:DNA-binding response regulator [Streptomyces sp. CWNU-1]MCM2387920.1 DNA-binding response regulator [Streptomyces sp. CWNU-1]